MKDTHIHPRQEKVSRAHPITPTYSIDTAVHSLCYNTTGIVVFRYIFTISVNVLVMEYR